LLQENEEEEHKKIYMLEIFGVEDAFNMNTSNSAQGQLYLDIIVCVCVCACVCVCVLCLDLVLYILVFKNYFAMLSMCFPGNQEGCMLFRIGGNED
jgi:hypothetical protein